MDSKVAGNVDISLEKKLCAFGLLGFYLGGLLYVVTEFLLGFEVKNLIQLIGVIISFLGFLLYSKGIYNFSKKLCNKDIYKSYIFSITVPISVQALSLILLFVFYIIYQIVSSYLPSYLIDSAFWVFIFLSIFFLWFSFFLFGFLSKKYLDIFYEYTNIDLFKYAGWGVFVGSILFIVFSSIGWIMAMIAFFYMPDTLKLDLKLVNYKLINSK